MTYSIIVYYYKKISTHGLSEFQKEIEVQFDDVIYHNATDNIALFYIKQKGGIITYLPQNKYIEIRKNKEEKKNE